MIDDVKFDEEEILGDVELSEGDLNFDDIMKDVSFDEIENQEENPRKAFVFDTLEDKETKPNVYFGDEDIMKNVVGNEDGFDLDVDVEKEILPENMDISPEDVNNQSGLDVLNLDDLAPSFQSHNDFQVSIEEENFSEDKLVQEDLSDFNFETTENDADVAEADFLPQVSDVDVTTQESENMGFSDFNFETTENDADVAEADFLPQVSDADVTTQESENTGFSDASDIEESDVLEVLDSSNEDSLDGFNFDNIIQSTEKNADIADEAESWTSSEGNSDDIDSDGLGQEIEEPFEEGEQSAVESYSQPTTEELEQAVENNVSWYSGALKDKYFEVSLMASSQDFLGDERCDAIYVNVGMDTYGWNAMFENGVFMNLRDLRTYQSRYGCLPDHQGLIMYGDLEFNFKNISRIIIYEAAEYFSYGIPEGNYRR